MWKQPKPKHKQFTEWLWVVWYPENLHMGERVDIGAFTLIQAQAGVWMGNDVQIGSHCSIYSVSTIDNKFGFIIIEDGARIGTHCTIMPGITVGQNALIAAHSFVNKNVPEGAFAYGAPIRIKT